MMSQLESTRTEKSLPQIAPPGQFCRRCGVIDETRIAPGKGRFLSALGYRGPKPETKQVASEQIGDMLRVKGGVYHGA